MRKRLRCVGGPLDGHETTIWEGNRVVFETNESDPKDPRKPARTRDTYELRSNEEHGEFLQHLGTELIQ